MFSRLPKSDEELRMGGYMVPLLPVDSSMIAAAGYDQESQTLYVLFNNGKVYEYYQVPQSEYESLISAESKGGHMRSQIIDVYPYSIFHGWRKGSPET